MEMLRWLGFVYATKRAITFGDDHMRPPVDCAISDIAGTDDGDDVSGWVCSFWNPVLGMVTGFGEGLVVGEDLASFLDCAARKESVPYPEEDSSCERAERFLWRTFWRHSAEQSIPPIDQRK